MFKKYSEIDNSNKQIINLIEKNKPFIVARFGIGPETYITYEYSLTKEMNLSYLNKETNALNIAGIYFNKNDTEYKKLRLYINSYETCVKNCDLLASFYKYRNMEIIQNYYSNKYSVSQIHSRSLEPFYQIQENIKPWTHYLKGKKVLIINPFVDSFQKQLKNGFQIFKDENKKIFLDGQDFVFYKSYQTVADNHIHDSWFETFNLMCKDISKIEFDIALLGCGGYGLPICNFIKTKLNKSAIYVGGGLQLLFGVMGTRWENNKMWREIIKENDSKFIRPSGDEICRNYKTIENGSYW